MPQPQRALERGSSMLLGKKRGILQVAISADAFRFLADVSFLPLLTGLDCSEELNVVTSYSALRSFLCIWVTRVGLTQRVTMDYLTETIMPRRERGSLIIH
jgi:hypothetical protein